MVVVVVLKLKINTKILTAIKKKEREKKKGPVIRIQSRVTVGGEIKFMTNLHPFEPKCHRVSQPIIGGMNILALQSLSLRVFGFS